MPKMSQLKTPFRLLSFESKVELVKSLRRDRRDFVDMRKKAVAKAAKEPRARKAKATSTSTRKRGPKLVVTMSQNEALDLLTLLTKGNS
jgi:hypothetical protein